MLNVFKMDMWRLLRSKALYICLVSMNLVTGSMIIFDVVPDFASLMGISSDGNADMMGTMMGIGLAFLIIGVLSTLHICGDFSSGFAKNIFTRHANPMRYFGGKLLSLTVTGAVMLIIFTLFSALLLAIFGSGAALPGGFGGLLVFLVEKVIMLFAFNALVLLACLMTRKPFVGIVVASVAAMGVVPMLLSIAGDALELSIISDIGKYTISGLSSQANLMISGSAFITILLGGALWTGLCALLGNRAIKLKDV